MASVTNNTRVYWMNKYGNAPYVTCYYNNWTCTVDENKNHPWSVTFSRVGGFLKVTDIGWLRAFHVWITAAHFGNSRDWFGIGFLDPGNGKKYEGAKKDGLGTITDIRDYLGTNFKPHTWVNLDAYVEYTYMGTAAGIEGTSGSRNFYNSVRVYTPASGFGTGGSGSVSYRGTRYTWRWITFTGRWQGVAVGNSGTFFKLKSSWGGTIASGGFNQSSGSIDGRLKFNAPGNYTVSLWSCNPYTGEERKIAETTITITYPPPEPPGELWLNNTGQTSINTTRRKTLSANWGVGYVGYPADYVLYQVECWSTAHGCIWSTETYGTSASFQWDIPQQHTGCNIYWRMRARNGVGWAGWVQSGQHEIFWAYNEPKIITGKSLSPRSFQLFDGTTTITFSAESYVNGWGDRPGNKQVEYRLWSNGNVLKYYGRTNFTGTGVFAQTMSYNVYETELHKTYDVRAHKMLSGIEYLTSNDPKNPALGTNNCSVGNINFYEVIAKVSGSFRLEPTVIISGIASEFHYKWSYDKQSSEKVTYFIEVFRVPTNKVTKIINLDKDIKTSKSLYEATTSVILVEPQQADEYEIRLKCTVTELLGNTHTYTLYTLKPEVYNPPIAHLALDGVSKPLPTNNANSYLAKQDTNITFDYDYSYGGIAINKVILVTQSSFGLEQTNMIFVPGVTPYYNKYTRISTGDFDLNSKVQSYIRIYYQIYGYSKMYDVVSNTVTVNITPTRYLYYLTQVATGEKQLNKIHPLVGERDQISKRIFIEPKED